MLSPSHASNNSKKSNDERTATLLDYQFRPMLAFVILLYILLMIFVGMDQKYSQTPICHSQVHLEEWVNNAVAMAAGCAALTCTLQIIRIVSLLCSKSKMRNTPLIRVNVVMLVLNGISGSSMTMTLFWRYGGICEDSFGVFSPGTQWGEWFVLVPLLNYVACAVEQKKQMDTFDVWMVSLLALMVLSGFLMIIRGPYGLATFFLLVSLACLATVTAMSAINYRQIAAKVHVKLRMSNYFSSKQTHRKATLLVQLLTIMWYYPIVWLLGALNVLDASRTYAAYMIGSIFGKVIFSSLVIESHVTLLYEFLITTANNLNIGEEDHIVLDTSVSPKFSRTKKKTISVRAAPPELSITPVPPASAAVELFSAHNADIPTIMEETDGTESTRAGVV